MKQEDKKKELEGYRRLALVLSNDLRRRRIQKLTKQAKARNRKTSK